MLRPRTCSAAVLARLCTRIAAGEPLKEICSDPRMPTLAAVSRWRLGDPDVKNAICEIRAQRAVLLTDEVIDIADGVKDPNSPAGAKIRIEARKWALSRTVEPEGEDGKKRDPEARVGPPAGVRRRIAGSKSRRGGGARAGQREAGGGDAGGVPGGRKRQS
jgi:hypothetical protein